MPVVSGSLVGAVRQALPIVLGYVPVGFAFGVLALKNGISPANAVLMSVIVFAGSAQLIAVGLIGAGAAPLSVIATTFVVNLRHLLMAASLAPFLSTWGKRRLAWFGLQLTDETFAVHSVRFHRSETDAPETFGINAIAHLGWIAGSWLGVAASTVISDVRPLGLDYALPAMFIALVVAQTRHLTHVIVGLAAGTLSLVFFGLGIEQWNVILATVAGASIGTGVAAWTRD